LAENLLAAAPTLNILATSRQPLGATGEQRLVLGPFAVPDEAPAANARSSAAVALFAQRAAEVAPPFTITPENERTVARLCRRLDGIPLGIELAAVRLREMPLEEILDRIEDRFDLLYQETSAARHRTLRAAMQWSYQLCTA